ncbi:pksE, partial [Symbiodinium pilosum]
LSLGEYVALTAAGVFDFETGLRLIKVRAEAMQFELSGGRPGAKAQGMCLVVGMVKDEVERL